MAASGIRNAAQGQKLAVANSQFALDLYLRQSTTTPKNIFISPLSISVALAMTYAGARENTKTQMRDVLKFGEVEEGHLHQAFSDLRSSLNKPGNQYTLHMANRLFGSASYVFAKEYLSLGREHYGADLAPIDFGDSSRAASIINSWVAENTNKMITDIIPADAINALTRLVLVNAIYFKGDWANKFDKALTTIDDFHVSPTQKIKVELMHMWREEFGLGFSPDLNSQALELPYVGDALSMFIVLPDKQLTSLAAVESKLTVDTLHNVERSFCMSRHSDVNVWIPRFRLDEKLELTETLRAMGMYDAFSDIDADFSGMDGTKSLYISKVLHRAVVDVTEEGTEAAAATDVGFEYYEALRPKVLEFRADHPFLFFIRDNVTKSILFLGRLTEPEKFSSAKKD